MATSHLLEKDIEDIIAKHHSYFIEPGLSLKDRQVSIRGGRADLLFIDRFGDELLIEIKRGTVNREAVAQLLDYLGHITRDGTRTRLMLIAGSIAANWKMSLDHQGIEYREYTEKDYLTYLETHDQDLLRRIMQSGDPKPTPSEERIPIHPRNLCDELKDFLAFRNFNAGEGIKEKSTEQWLQDRKRAKEKYRKIFHPTNLEKMSNDDFKSFLYFRNNRCWTQLYRSSLRLINDMGKLRKAIAHLQDETLPIEDRLRDVLYGGSYWINGLGINVATGILHICDQSDRYGVWNNRTVDALTKLGYLKQRVYNRGADYITINDHLHSLRSDLRKCRPDMDIDLGLVDSFVWFISKDKLDYVESDKKTTKRTAGTPQNEEQEKQNKVSKEEFFNSINNFEREARVYIKTRLGANYEGVLQSTAPELIKKWTRRRRRDIENDGKTESEIINYAEVGDFIQILLRNREIFNKEGYFLTDVVTHLKKISYNRGKVVHPGDNELNIQQFYVVKDAIEWIQNWMRA